MALDLVTRLTLDTQQYDKNLQKSKESLESFRKKQNSVGNSTNIFANGLSKSIGGLVGSIGKLVPAFTAASVGFEAFNRHLKMNEYALDSFNKMTEQAQAAVDQLATTIISLNAIDLSNVVSQLNDVKEAQGRLYDAEDTLGTYNVIMSPDIEKWEAKRTEAQTNLKDARARGDKEAVAKFSADLKKASDAEKKLIQGQIDLTRKAQEEVYNTIRAKSGIKNLTEAELNKFSKGFLYYDAQINKGGSFKFVKGRDLTGFGTKEGSLGEIVNDWYGNRKGITVTDPQRIRDIEARLDKYIRQRTGGMSAYELYRAYKVRGVGEDSGIKEYYRRDKEIWGLVQQQNQIDKQNQKVLKDESSAAKATTKAVQKQEKTTNEFQDAIDRFKSTANALKNQKESGVIGDAEYRESFQSALSNMVKTLMSADVWNKLTDGQKEYVKTQADILSRLVENNKAIREYNSKSKTDYRDIKSSDDKREDFMIMQMYQTAYQSKNPKDTYFAKVKSNDSKSDNGKDNEATRRNFERIIGGIVSNRLKIDMNIALPEEIEKATKGEVKARDVRRTLGQIILNDNNDDFISDLLNQLNDVYQFDIAEAIDNYLTDLKYQMTKFDLTKEAPRYTDTITAEELTLRPLFMKSNPNATDRDYWEFANSYYEKLIEDLQNLGKTLDEGKKNIDNDLNKANSDLVDTEKKYDEAVKKFQGSNNEGEGNEIKELGDDITNLKNRIEILEKERTNIELKSDTNNSNINRIQEYGINAQNKLNDYKDVDARIKKWQELASAAYETANALGTLSNAFAEAGNQSAASALNIIGGLTQMIGIVGEAIGKILGLMTANNVKSASELPFPANLAAIGVAVGASASVASTVMSMSRKKYAQGGIVQGIGSSFSDQIPISVSNGEMILNKGQQRNLFNLLDRGIGGIEGKIEFKNKLVGSDIIGSATTYNKRRNLIL